MGSRHEALFSAVEVAAWSNGKLDGDSSAVLTGVIIDSRECGPGGLFVALKGENTDGHNYLDKAYENGAAGAVVSERWILENEYPDIPEGRFLLTVAEPLEALQAVAAAYLGCIKHPVRIGVTGSNGKTTTKELISRVLSKKYSVVKTEGNFNSEIGLPLSVFNIKDRHDYAVIEMGINRVGEMDVLTEILRPDIVVITNIGTAHIGIFKTRETIAFEKRRAMSLFNDESVLFLDENCDFRDFLVEEHPGRLELFGCRSLVAEGHSLSALSRGLKGWTLSLDEREIAYPLIGEHNLKNALCAVKVGLFADVPRNSIAEALEEAQPLFGRSQIIDGPVTIIQDCYNANADSLLGSISFADDLEWEGAKRYVIGDMKELGASSREIHEAAGRASAAGAAAEVFFFGEDAEVSYKAAVSAGEKLGGTTPRFFWTDDFKVLESKLFKSITAGDLLLLKASRSMNLERLVPMVEEYNRGKRC
ncbi:MAG: UDP-N-acetylmuramoyl-tripeptide--D-alanyl-D-alanine ligase [Spirochaetales bacterium]|nr:UDP-N-acetylmuramoyl-tripeptide--D-alanyl-D-alanine ligase [Spirochaetales bacterium]